MNKLSWSVDAHACLDGIGVHDAVIESLRLVQKKELYLDIKAVSGRKLRMVCSGIEDVRLNFLEAAIVGDVFIQKLSEMADSIGHGWHGGFAELFEANTPSEIVQRSFKITQESHPDYFLVTFDFSYGGPIAVVCQAVNFYEVEAFEPV